MNRTAAQGSQSSASLVEAELVNSIAWLIDLRWLAGMGVLGATWLTDVVVRLPLPTLPLYLIGLTIILYNAIFRFALQRLRRDGRREIRRFDLLTHSQIGFDWLAMIALIHFSGGVLSPALFYFFFHIVIAATLLSMRATFFYATLATLLMGAMAWLEYAGIMPHVAIWGPTDDTLYRQPVFVFGVLFFFASTMFVAAYLGSTLNARLRAREVEVVELSQNLLRAYDRLQTVYEAAEDVTSTLELDQVLERLTRRAANALGVRSCSIRLLDETGARLYVAASYGMSKAYATKGDLLLEQNPLARDVLAGRTIITGDVAKETRLQYPAQAIAEGIRSMLTAPLIGKQGPLGLIRAYSGDVNHFTRDDAEFLDAIAREGSIALQNAMAYRALGKLDEMKSKFVLTVTHELRSPVSVVRSLMRTMLAGYVGTLTEQQREMLTRVQYRADFLQTLIDDLLDLAAGKTDLAQREERVIVPVDRAVERVVKRFEVAATEKQIKLDYQCQPGNEPLTISASNEGIDRILNNLVSNAIKYTGVGGRVTVTLSARDGSVRIEIADSGIGIPPEALPHLFEEFYRAPNAKAQVKEGTGLGLAIAKDLVTRYGGHIAVQSHLGQGTTFAITFPVVVQLSI